MTLTELDFQRQLVGPTGLATMLGWVHVHFRPAKTAHGWRTAGTGELAEGWPDLLLIHVARRRLLFRELKSDSGQLTARQAAVLAALMEAGLDAGVWRPRDMDRIAQELR